MMHSIKSQSPLKHDLKLGVHKSSPNKTLDTKNLVGLLNKTVNPHNVQQTESLKLNIKTDHVHSLQESESKLSLKKSQKRKEDRTALLSRKRKKREYDKEIEFKCLNERKLLLQKQKELRSIYSKDNASYVCKFCCRHFCSVEQLREHSLSHKDQSTYVCHICNHETAGFSALMTHVVKHSRKTEKNKSETNGSNMSSLEKPKDSLHCNLCKLTFTSFQKISNHSCSTVVPKSEYKCVYCRQVSTCLEDYRSHVKSHSISPFICIHCKIKFPTKRNLDKHQESCTKKIIHQFKCSSCSFSCKGKKELNQHKKICNLNNKSSLYKCSRCNLNYDIKSEYNAHLTKCKEPTITPVKKRVKLKRNALKLTSPSFVCSLCDSVFNTKVDHEKHEESCLRSNITEGPSASCPSCGLLCNLSLLDEHIKTCSPSPVNSNKETSPNKKNVFEDSPNTRRSARLVGKKHVFSSEKEAIVKEIPKPKQVRKLKIINKIKCRKGRQSKVGKENFMCGECSLTFCSKSTLLRHKRMHSGNPWFSCKYCGKYFFRKDVFNRHEMNVHSKSSKNLFCCYYCKLFFNAAILLKDHVSASHKENSYLTNKPNVTVDSYNEDGDTHMQVKQEPVSTASTSEAIDKTSISDNQTTSENLLKARSSPLSILSPFKKCGICFQTFETVPQIEEHLQSHPVLEKCETAPTSEDNLILSKQNKTVFDTTDFILKSEEQVSVVQKPTTLKPTTIEVVQKDQSIPGRESLNNISENNFSELPIFAAEVERHICKLCLKECNDKKSLKDHEAQQHIMIDWYQCLVCNVSGSKREMQEHMFTHMYKMGTFVVANNYCSVDNILPSLQQCMTIHEHNISQTNLIDNDCEQKSSNCEEINIELPKLRYCGQSSPLIENEDHITSVVSEENVKVDVSLNNKCELEPNVEIMSANDVADLEKTDNSTCVELSLIEDDLEPDISNISAESTAHSNSSEEDEENAKDPFQELRKILKADNIPLKESSTSQNILIEGENSKTHCLDENSSNKQSYSQLRYLLEKTNKLNSPPLINPDSYNQSENTKEFEPAKNESEQSSDVVSSMKDLIQDLKSLNKLVSESVPNSDIIEEVNFKTVQETEKVNKLHLSQIHNTCLKFDINQSRSEFSETANASLSKQKSLESSTSDKINSLFQPTNSQNTILDFSDLLKIGDSISATDNIFEFGSQNSGMLGVCSNSHCAVDLEDKRPVDLTSSILSSTDLLKCNKCDEKFKDYSEIAKHLCSKDVAISEHIVDPESKIDFSLPFDLTKSTNSNYESTKEQDNACFMMPFLCCVCNKTLKSSFILEQHYRTDHNCYSNSTLSNKCLQCCEKIFSTSDFMKHSLNCQKLNWNTTNHLNDNSKCKGLLQTLLSKSESEIHAKHSPNSGTSSENATDFSYDNILNLSQNSFNS